VAPLQAVVGEDADHGAAPAAMVRVTLLS
jgi:hypothetical protein